MHTDLPTAPGCDRARRHVIVIAFNRMRIDAYSQVIYDVIVPTVPQPDSRPTLPSRRRVLLAVAMASTWAGPGTLAARPQVTLDRPRSLATLFAAAERGARPVVALFSLRGCGFCEAIRREQLGHLAREAAARGVLVAEFDIADERPFAAPPPASTATTTAPPLATARSPAQLARMLGIRLAPTVAFLSVRGELAPRLPGYSSPDFYGAYLDERVEQSRAALKAARGA